MNHNQAIQTYLTSRREEALSAIRHNPLTKAVCAQLEATDLTAVTRQFAQEIGATATKWWPTLDADKPIDAILFEYDYLYEPNPMADLYGCRFTDPADLHVQAESYFIGWDYDMPLEALPGITLSLLNPLYLLQNSGNTELFENTKLVAELRNAYLFTAFLALHHAVAELVQTDVYEHMPRRRPFHFLIQEHDMAETYPIYIETAIE